MGVVCAGFAEAVDGDDASEAAARLQSAAVDETFLDFAATAMGWAPGELEFLEAVVAEIQAGEAAAVAAAVAARERAEDAGAVVGEV